MSSTTLPLPVRRTYGWRSWRDPLLESLLAIAAGCAFSLIESKGHNELPPLHTLVRNSIFGLSILILSRGLETMLSWAIEQSRVPIVFRTVIYALGAWVGFFLGLVAVASLYGAEESDFRFHSFHFIYSITAAALLACVVGFILHHNQKRKDRLQRAYDRLKEHEFAEKELEIARAMQERLLPPASITQPGYRVEARTHAARIVAGDFYDVIQLPDDAVAVLAADVSGKGIAASLLMASCKAAAPFLASSGSARDVMSALNARLYDQLERREFVAMIYARFDPRTGDVDIVNAGMPDPFVIGSSGDLRTISFRGDRLPLGAMRGPKYESTHFALQSGERLLLFSDGLPEALQDGTPIGYERAEALVRGARDIDEIVNRITTEPSITIEDDLTLVMLERLWHAQ
ncbi:MAG TPA: PP2C family protein-serine/threonine phosphatase [Thermoanaerobaculia bacterium]|jgi:serine phosphatase RsbU (regulator of sigma subunit)